MNRNYDNPIRKCEFCNEPIYNTDYRKRETATKYCYLCDQREERISWNIRLERICKPRCE